MNATPDRELENLVKKILEKRKYRFIDRDLIQSVAESESAKGRKKKETEKAILSKLHQVGAAYFTQKPDFPGWSKTLASLPKDLHADETRAFCREVMQGHYSTEERLPILNSFFRDIMQPIVPIPSVLDLACGLNPLALSWMPVDKDVRFYGCDIFSDMVEFLNAFGRHFGIQAEFTTCNLLDMKFKRGVKVALLLKSIPCLEQLKRGFIPELLRAIPAEYILASYPISSLSGKSKGMREQYTSQFIEIISQTDWTYEEFTFSSELAFLIKKQ